MWSRTPMQESQSSSFPYNNLRDILNYVGTE